MQYLRAAELKGLPRIASIQNAYSLVNRTFEVNLAEACLREDVGLLCYSALAQGYLTGKYRNGRLPEGARKTLFDRLEATLRRASESDGAAAEEAKPDADSDAVVDISSDKPGGEEKKKRPAARK